MSEQLFDVVFFGILQAGKDKETVMQNMATLFKSETSKLAPYFAGGRKVLKSEVNADTAEKYQAALENVGMVIKLEPCITTQSAVTATRPEAEQSTDHAVQPAKSTTPELTDNKAQNNDQTDISGLSIAPVGVNVLEHSAEVTAQKIADIGDITMAEVGVDIITNPDKVTPQAIADIKDMTLADVGSNVLEKPTQVSPQKIDDISSISVADAGVDLIANPAPEKQADIPDTSDLSLDVTD